MHTPTRPSSVTKQKEKEISTKAHSINYYTSYHFWYLLAPSLAFPFTGGRNLLAQFAIFFAHSFPSAFAFTEGLAPLQPTSLILKLANEMHLVHKYKSVYYHRVYSSWDHLDCYLCC